MWDKPERAKDLQSIVTYVLHVSFYIIFISNSINNLIVMQDMKKVYTDELEKIKSLVAGLGLDLNRRLSGLENVCKL